jgi:Low-density lipoprotein receptor domain class A
MRNLARPALLLTALLTACPGTDDPESREGGPPMAVVADGGPAVTGAVLDGGAVREGGLPANDGGTASDLELERQYIDKLKACGMYEPSVDPAEYRIRDEFDRCMGRCALAAGCPQLVSLACDEDDSPLLTCLLACPDPPSDGFRCRDGSRIPHAALCDLVPDCPAEEDESGCGEFRCADGEVLPAKSARCDYFDDCEDGSDERGCTFQCS